MVAEIVRKSSGFCFIDSAIKAFTLVIEEEG